MGKAKETAELGKNGFKLMWLWINAKIEQLEEAETVVNQLNAVILWHEARLKALEGALNIDVPSLKTVFSPPDSCTSNPSKGQI